jgi:AraC-like DNA-binding protein
MQKKHLYIFWLLFLGSSYCDAQDTIFVKSHDLKNIRNIDVLDGKLLIRFSKSYTFYSNNKYENEEELPYNTKAFTWVDDLTENTNIYHSDYFPKDKLYKNSHLLKKLIPGEVTENISLARIKNAFYICWKGKLLEYKIYNHYRRILKESSIRHIYKDQNQSIVSSYSGIFNYDEEFNAVKKFAIPTYSNGELNYINNRYYLSSDDLYVKEKDSFKLFWKREGIEKFREIFNYNGKTYALFEHSLSEINLSLRHEKVIKKIKNLSDAEKYKSQLLLSSEDGGLYSFQNNKIKKVYNCSTGIYDVASFDEKIYLCCNDGIRILNKKYEELKFIAIYKPISILPLDNALITSTYKGLYYVDLIKNKSYELIPDVEFNKKAFTRFDNYIYAGSVQGLYILNIVELSTNFLESLESTTISTKPNSYSYFVITFITFLAFIAIMIFYRRKNGVKIAVNQKEIFDNMESIYQIIKLNPGIKSVEDLADYIGVSSPTLISKIKRQTGANPLTFLKESKKNIAIELFNEGVSVEEIAKRIGYSVRYIKSNFLNKKSI